MSDYDFFALKQKSLGSYIKRYASKNLKTEDLWSVLSEESGIDVTKIMETWTKQKGYPFISVKSKDRTLEFEQVLFFIKDINGSDVGLHKTYSIKYKPISLIFFHSQFLSSGLHGDGQ